MPYVGSCFVVSCGYLYVPVCTGDGEEGCVGLREEVYGVGEGCRDRVRVLGDAGGAGLGLDATTWACAAVG